MKRKMAKFIKSLPERLQASAKELNTTLSTLFYENWDIINITYLYNFDPSKKSKFNLEFLPTSVSLKIIFGHQYSSVIFRNFETGQKKTFTFDIYNIDYQQLETDLLT